MSQFKSKFAPKASTVEAKAPRVKRPARVPEQDVQDAVDVSAQRVYAERIASAQDEYLASVDAPTHTRMLVASVTQLLTFSVSMYWSVQLTGWVMTAALLFTGSSFVAVLIAILGLVLAFKAAWRAGFTAAEVVSNASFKTAGNVGASIKDAAARKVSMVRGWFVRDDIVAA